jgi:hypothetical protein
MLVCGGFDADRAEAVEKILIACRHTGGRSSTCRTFYGLPGGLDVAADALDGIAAGERRHQCEESDRAEAAQYRHRTSLRYDRAQNSAVVRRVQRLNAVPRDVRTA